MMRTMTRQALRFWAGAMMPVMFMYGVSDPRVIEEHGKLVGDKRIAERWLIRTNLEDHIERLEKYIEMGFEHIYVASTSPYEMKTLRTYVKQYIF